MDGENGGMGYRGTESRGEAGERRSQSGGAGIMEGGEERTERGEGQVVMNVLLFTACCLQYGCVCVCVHTCGSCGCGSFVRQTHLTASVTSHLEGGALKHTFLDTTHTAQNLEDTF